MRVASRTPPVPKHQADAVLNQAAPVQNTWYTILDTTKNAVLYLILVLVADTDETLECRITVDGNALVDSIAATADTVYCMKLDSTTITGDTYVLHVTAGNVMEQSAMEGRSVKVEVRKTTATGAGNLKGRVVYGKW